MASYREPIIKAFKAGEDLSAKQYHFVKIGSNDDEVVAAGAGEKTVGILMNDPANGGDAEVALPGGGALIKLAEALSALALLTPTTAGKGEQVDSADEWAGAIIQEAGAQDDVVECYVTAMYSSKSDA